MGGVRARACCGGLTLCFFALPQDKGKKPRAHSLVRTASQTEQRRRVAAVQQLHDEIGTQQRLDDELQRVAEEMDQLRVSQR